MSIEPDRAAPSAWSGLHATVQEGTSTGPPLVAGAQDNMVAMRFVAVGLRDSQCIQHDAERDQYQKAIAGVTAKAALPTEHKAMSV